MEARPTVLVANDDGVRSALLQELVRRMSAQGLDVVVVAPTHDQSACGQKLNMHRDLMLRRHDSASTAVAARAVNKAHFYCLDGSPSDCIIAALEPRNGVLAQLGKQARLVVSGINKGPNLASDVFYSGTFAAARQAGMYGVPSIATSWASYGELRPSDIESATDATMSVINAALRFLLTHDAQLLRSELVTRDHHTFRPRVESLALGENVSQDEVKRELEHAAQSTASHIREAFRHGDVILNLNVPPEWNGRFQPSTLGAVLYRDSLRDVENSALIEQAADDGSRGRVARVVRIGGGGVHIMPNVPHSDTDAVQRGLAAISTLNCWPETHPLQLHPAMLRHALVESPSQSALGLPLWLG